VAFVGLGVSGGIGAYKAVEVARLLQKRGHRVQAVMTRTARRFVGAVTFEAITREPVITSQFAPGMNADIEHIALASSLDLLLVAPATANIIGKFANGIADDFLSALYLATRAPVLMAPAMNTNMWDHPAVVSNMATLTARGVRFVDPGEGYLACGWIGKGRLAEPEMIAEAADRILRPQTALSGQRILVTAGPTFEDLDPVRFLGNRSSGRMGFAIAEEAARRGAIVTLVAGPTPVDPPKVAETIRIRSAREMHAEVIARAHAVDVVIMAAAVADYSPVAGAANAKIEKGGPLTITLEPTPDILAEIGARRQGNRPVLVGFAAQTDDPVPAAGRKLMAKKVDLIVANDVTVPGAGFDVDTNIVTLVDSRGDERLPLMSKRDVAAAILDRVEAALQANGTSAAASIPAS
jgi:phosphopantothenoylcysteine decarboxylase / phosphopantothenate---cysteine ligase